MTTLSEYKEMVELKPCLLCASRKVHFHKDDECKGCHYIVCLDCKAMFDLSDSVDADNDCEELEDLQARIAVRWNNRDASQSDAKGGE